MSADELICRRILLVRHGHYLRTSNLGDEVWGLSPLGRRQSIRLADRLQRLLEASSSRLEGIYSSPWPRALQTAEVVVRKLSLGVKIKPDLVECPPLVDPRDRNIQEIYPDLVPSSPQERQATTAQVLRVRQKFFRAPSGRRPGMVVLFTHGNLIRYLVASCLGLPFEAWAGMDVCHTGISEIRVYSGDFEALVSYNETGHLQPSMITSS